VVGSIGNGALVTDLSGAAAVVTGASRGVGKGCALELGAAGATVYVTGRSVDESDHPLPGTVGATVQEIKAAGGTAVAVAVDHRDDDAVAALFERVDAEQGRLDVLVNNAFLIPKELTSGLPFWEVPISNWDDMLDVGTRSAYVASVHAARRMVAAGAGLIVNVSSSGAEEYAWHVAYGVGKCALDRLTADTAVELAAHGVTVVSVWPGFVRTERIDVGAETGELPSSLDLDAAESPRFTGRGVVALAEDPDRAAFNGRAVAVRALAEHYGFRDVDGRLPSGPLRHRTV
jgi:dehydrogenase/reductase SDR family protein 1